MNLGGGEEVERLVSDVGGEMCTVFSTAVCVFFFFSPSLAANHGSAGGCPYKGFNSSSGCKRNSKERQDLERNNYGCTGYCVEGISKICIIPMHMPVPLEFSV